MKRILLVLAALASALVVGASPAGAVKYGTPDTANQYPWVGLMVAYDEDWTPLWRCTGSLLSDDLFLTAAHCVEEPAAHIAIWFDWDVRPSAGTGYPNPASADVIGLPEPHPSWSGRLTIPQTYDVGVVYDLTFQNGYTPTSYGQIAPVGYLDELAYEQGKGNVQFTVVGYGLQSVKPVLSAARVRMIGTVSLVNLKSALAGGWNLHYSSNPGQGHGGSGGTCFGDSGGPVIHDGLIVAVNSFVLNGNCMGAGFGYRVDTALAQSFVFGPHPAS